MEPRRLPSTSDCYINSHVSLMRSSTMGRTGLSIRHSSAVSSKTPSASRKTTESTKPRASHLTFALCSSERDELAVGEELDSRGDGGVLVRVGVALRSQQCAPRVPHHLVRAARHAAHHHLLPKRTHVVRPRLETGLTEQRTRRAVRTQVSALGGSLAGSAVLSATRTTTRT